MSSNIINFDDLYKYTNRLLIKMYKTILLIFLLTNICSGVGVQIKNRKIMDQDGRQIRFHGPNVVVKVPPYMPIRDHYDADRSFSEVDMVNAQKWGWNAIRLGMMWAGVEPTSEGYNQTYLNQMQELINEAGSHGIYTLIDFHQDLIAEKYCGDGVPTWLIDEIKGYKTFPFPMGKKIHLNQSGLPSWSDCDKKNWGMYYFSHDVAHTFQQLYTIGSKLNKKFTDFWKKIVSRFKGNKFVIAYELINEPFVGNPYRNPTILIPSVAERVNFQSFYDNLAQEIRTEDQETPICFQPITFDQSVPAGFSHPPGGNRYKNVSIFCYHYYNPPGLSQKTIDARVKDGQRLGVPSMLDQFSQVDSIVKAQQYKQSWMFWGYKNFGKDWGSNPFYTSQSQEKGVKATKDRVITYLQRIDGTLINEEFNFQSFSYVAIYEARPGGKSILFYSKQYHYPKGYLKFADPQQFLLFNEVEAGYIQITYTGSQTRIVQITLQSIQ